jgi:hypothetical protein
MMPIAPQLRAGAGQRRQTNTINWTTELPLAQGIKFGD